MKLSSDARVCSRTPSDRAREPRRGQFREGRSFQKAYLLDLLQEMLEAGVSMLARTRRRLHGNRHVRILPWLRVVGAWLRDQAHGAGA